MSELLAKNKAPSFVSYIISINLFLMISQSLSLYFNAYQSVGCVVICSTSSQAIVDTWNAGILFISFILSGIEIILLRRGFGKFSFSASFLIEIVRLYALATQLISINNQIIVALSGASMISVFLTKIFNKNINDLIKNPMSQNLGQIIPALAIVLIFTGSSLLSSLGFGAVSQEPNPKPFNLGTVDFNMFKTPSWNAQYYLDNILDQFRAGMNQPFTPVFNVTNRTPDPVRFGNGSEAINSYFKQQTYYEYRYDPVKAKSGTFFPAPTGTTTEKYYVAGTTFTNQTLSKQVPFSELNQTNLPTDQRNYNVYQLTVTTLMNHTSLFDQSLPASWNGRTYGINGGPNQFYGSFINPNQTVVYTSGGNIVASCTPLQGISNCAFTETQSSVQDFPVSSVGLRMDGFNSSGNNQFMNYSINYLEPNYQYINSHSGTIANYQNVFTPAEWNAISSTYLQMPSSANGTAPTGYPSYATNCGATNCWAPLVETARNQYFNPNGTVMQNVNNLIQAMTPAINSTILNVHQPGGSMGLTFDADFWATGIPSSTKAGVAYPKPGEDYVNWFLTVKKGLSSEFAAAMTMILRSEGIPARFVTGYAIGNSSRSATSNPYQTVYQRLHKMAWTEVLVPLLTANGPSFEWVIADPIGSILAAALGTQLLGSQQGSSTGTSLAFLDPYSLNLNDDLSTLAGQTNFANSIDRVGVDQKNYNPSTGTWQFDNSEYNDSGILKSNTFKTNSSTQGVVHVGVFVARLYYSGSTVTSFVGAGAMNVTFQVLANASLTALNWNQTQGITNISVTSNSSTSIAQVTFTYMPFYPNKPGLVPLHGSSPLIFAAMPGFNQSVDSTSCRGPNKEITCAYGFSDTNRTDDSFNVSNAANLGINNNGVKYDPFQVVTNSGAPYDLLTISTNIIPLINIHNKIISNLPGIAKIFHKINSDSLNANNLLQSPQNRLVSLGVLSAITVCLIPKIISKKKLFFKF